ncbi:MAG TPA: DUF3126 family protein [Hyphomicrobiaceae bacterium]|nr:DUF3126 family protein [Hyphomicrobiaceae bacterium]
MAHIKQDIPRLEKYLRKLFRTEAVRIVPNSRKSDMAEVFIGEDYLAPIYREDEDGDVSFQLQLVIIDLDLEND